MPKQPAHKDTRDPWDMYFMKLAYFAASRATCPRRSVGAILTDNKRVRGTGYNGSPPSTPDCLEEGCLMRDGSCVRTVHAELNALLHCDPSKFNHAVMYCTDRPCFACANAIASSGIKEVVYAREYSRDEDIVLEVFAKAGVTMRHYPLSGEWTELLLNQPDSIKR